LAGGISLKGEFSKRGFFPEWLFEGVDAARAGIALWGCHAESGLSRHYRSCHFSPYASFQRRLRQAGAADGDTAVPL
jgi:hypothetical protein